jgi:hypothetical protein
LKKATRLRGKNPLAVALIIRYASGLRGNAQTVELTNKLAEKFGVSPKSKRAGMRSLELAGLIKVERPPKKSPIVTIIDPDFHTRAGRD